MNSIYLDHAAATPLDRRVMSAMQPYYERQFYNPSAAYAAAVQVRTDIDASRVRIAAVLGCRPAEIILTAGGTEANNLAISGAMQALRRIDTAAKVIVTAVEHESVRAPAKLCNHDTVAVGSDGIVDTTALESLIDDHVGLVSVMYANNEIGTIQPVSRVAALLDSIKLDRRRRRVSLPLLLHCDAAQAGNYLDLHVSRLGIDMMTLNGGKIYGPKQSGILYVKAGVRLEPIVVGGGQERGMRSGTENVPAIIGFATALELVQLNRHDESKRLQSLQKIWISELARVMPRAVINGSLKHRLPNNIHASFPGCDNERLIYQLDMVGIMAAAGSACSASHDESSHVLAAIGLNDSLARASLRFTMGQATTEADVRQVVNMLAAATQAA